MKAIVLSMFVLTAVAIFGCSDKSTDVRVARSNVDFHRGPVDDGLSVRPHPTPPPVENPKVTLRGSFEETDEGCFILTQDDGTKVDLQFNKEFPTPKFPKGTRVEATGEFAARLGSRCVGGPILEVDSIRQAPGDKEDIENDPVDM